MTLSPGPRFRTSVESLIANEDIPTGSSNLSRQDTAGFKGHGVPDGVTLDPEAHLEIVVEVDTGFARI